MKRFILVALVSVTFGLLSLAGCNEESKCSSCSAAPAQAAPAK